MAISLYRSMRRRGKELKVINFLSSHSSESIVWYWKEFLAEKEVKQEKEEEASHGSLENAWNVAEGRELSNVCVDYARLPVIMGGYGIEVYCHPVLTNIIIMVANRLVTMCRPQVKEVEIIY